MADGDIRYQCVHLQQWHSGGHFDGDYDIVGDERDAWTCWQFPGELFIQPSTRCGPRCTAFRQRNAATRHEQVPRDDNDAQSKLLGPRHLPRDIKPSEPRRLPRDITRSIIEGRHRRVYASLEQQIDEAERVETTLRRLPAELTRINAALKVINIQVAEATQAQKATPAAKPSPLNVWEIWSSKKNGRRRGTTSTGKSHLTELRTKRARLDEQRKYKARKRDKLLSELPSARQRKEVLVRLRTELQRLVESALAGDDAASHANNSGLDALFAKVGACLGEGVPLTTLEECVGELELLKEVPPPA